MAERAGGERPGAGEVLVSARGLEKIYRLGGGEVHALRGVDLDIRTGEMVALMGASGVGKSTLLHVLGALDRPTSGDVFLNGERLFQRSDTELARFRNRFLGFVFQFHHLLPEFSALENVMIPGLLGGEPRPVVEGRARKLIEQVGLGKRWKHRPAELSGGEQQRVALARALLNRPALVLADEPTGNLDSSTAEAVFGLLREFNQMSRQTFLVATHNNSLAERMDRVVIMADGKIAAVR
ncbi:MAG: ABC transporter ATP-binding protein [Candidatus Tectomicrobia bacterium]|uniref:ABC transporter ATP-binding protein n=1 Tax=Tectimicrobiota bacterium TaxID=2528274 RepID=A0A932HX25_UNCTE|nr:ABC transporter ATP-binding protein [Candidatus Tectomicrobia bacterium]